MDAHADDSPTAPDAGTEAAAAADPVQARRAILEQVAAGELGPEEAASRLAALDDGPGPTSGAGGDADDVGGHRDLPPAWAPAPDGVPGEGRARRIEIRAALRSVIIEGDSGVAEASPSGAHRAFREGDALVISAEPAIEAPQGGFAFTYSYATGRRGMVTKTRPARAEAGPLRIRVNPDLPLEASVDAGSLVVRSVRAPVTLRVSAGSAKVEDLRGPLQAQVNAGSLSASGRIDSGASAITCDAGSVRLHLDRGSSVRLRLRTNLGKILLPDGSMAKGGPLDPTRASGLQVGGGAGTLDVSVNLGKIAITSDEGTTSVQDAS